MFDGTTDFGFSEIPLDVEYLSRVNEICVFDLVAVSLKKKWPLIGIAINQSVRRNTPEVFARDGQPIKLRGKATQGFSGSLQPFLQAGSDLTSFGFTGVDLLFRIGFSGNRFWNIFDHRHQVYWQFGSIWQGLDNHRFLGFNRLLQEVLYSWCQRGVHWRQFPCGSVSTIPDLVVPLKQGLLGSVSR